MIRMSHPDPNDPQEHTPIRVGEVWENPVNRERLTILECPWDNPARRPSHADRRNALRRWCVQNEIRAGQRRRRFAPKFGSLLRRLLKLVA